MKVCEHCGGAIAEAGEVLGGYVGPWCTCLKEHFSGYEKNSVKEGVDSTLEERGKRYGKFIGHAAIAQTLKSAMQNTAAWNKLHSDQKEALEMIQHKIARILNGDPDYADSWHDIAGYATLVENRLNGKVV